MFTKKQKFGVKMAKKSKLSKYEKWKKEREEENAKNDMSWDMAMNNPSRLKKIIKLWN